MPETIILALNSGSSSLKFGLFAIDDGEPRPVYSGAVEGIGAAAGHFWVRSSDGKMWKEDHAPVPDQAVALRTVALLMNDGRLPTPHAVAHRIVHGGPNLREHQRITPEVMKELERIAVFAPLHVPVELRLIRLSETHFPGVPQFACFDTAIHRTMPEQAVRFALPGDLWDAGVRRYGFHGLSCESVLHALGKDVPQRMIIAHLGSGASLTAVLNGVSVDNTMGMTPTGGIVMGTRPGDLDPGVFLYMLRTSELDVKATETMFDRKSGLLGISGVSSDMRQLHASNEPRAKMAVQIFCRSVKKAIGGFVAVLGGLDSLVFTGGIGENDAVARAEICHGLETIGIALDDEKNLSNLPNIHNPKSRAAIRVQHSDEEGQMARQTARFLK